MRAYLLHLILKRPLRYSEADITKLAAVLPTNAQPCLHDRDGEDRLKSLGIIFGTDESAYTLKRRLTPALEKFENWELIEHNGTAESKFPALSPIRNWLNKHRAELERPEADAKPKSDQPKVLVETVRRRGPKPRRQHSD